MRIEVGLIRIVLLALPGVIAGQLYRKLRGRRPRRSWEDFLEIFVFSLTGYLLVAAGLSLCNVLFARRWGLMSFGALFSEGEPIPWHEVAWASFAASGVSVLASYAHTYKWVSRLGRKARMTNRFGDEDVWEYLHNSRDIEWVFVRDHKLDLIYYAWISAFSDSEKDREMILRDVSVFRNDVDVDGPLYEVEALYISRDKYDLSIEIPSTPAEANRSTDDEER